MKHQRAKAKRLCQESKLIRRISKEYKELCVKAWNVPIVPLAEPYQRGYERFLRPTRAAEKRGEINDLRIALSYFQQHDFCRRGLFRYGNSRGSKGTWKKGEVGPHSLRYHSLAKLIKLGYPAHLSRYIDVEAEDLSQGLSRNPRLSSWQRTQRVSFIATSLIESHTRPYWVTHIRQIDPILEARIREIDQFLWGGRHTGAVHKALHLRNFHRFSFLRHPLGERIFREDAKRQAEEINLDPSIKSAVSPRFFISLVIIVY